MKIGDDRLDNVDLGRSSGTDLGLEDENLNCSQITVWAVENGRFELGRSSGTDLGLEDENSDVLKKRTFSI